MLSMSSPAENLNGVTRMIKSDTSEELSSMSLGERMAKSLAWHYPAYRGGWRIAINEPGGVVIITNILLSSKMGYVLPLSQVDSSMKAVIMAGGEILERYRQARTRIINPDKMLANFQAMKKVGRETVADE